MPGAPVFEIHGNIVTGYLYISTMNNRPSCHQDFGSNSEVIPIGSENWRPLGVTGQPKDENYTQIFRAP